MKRRAQIVLVGALLVGAAAISSMKRGGVSAGGRGRGGTCCSQTPELNVWTTVFPARTNLVTTNLGATASESATNH